MPTDVRLQRQIPQSHCKGDGTCLYSGRLTWHVLTCPESSLEREEVGTNLDWRGTWRVQCENIGSTAQEPVSRQAKARTVRFTFSRIWSRLKSDKPNGSRFHFLYAFATGMVKPIWELSIAPPPGPKFLRTASFVADVGCGLFPHVRKPWLCCSCSQCFRCTGLRTRKVGTCSHTGDQQVFCSKCLGIRTGPIQS